MKSRKEYLLGSGAIIGAFLSAMCWVVPMVVLSLGLGGFALSYVSVLAPYQRYIQFATIGMLMWAHYRMEKQPMKRSTRIFIWVATVIVFLILLTPISTRLLLL